MVKVNYQYEKRKKELDKKRKKEQKLREKQQKKNQSGGSTNEPPVETPEAEAVTVAPLPPVEIPEK